MPEPTRVPPGCVRCWVTARPIWICSTGRSRPVPFGPAARPRSLSEAGRLLFAESRKKKARPNDADRLRNYLVSFGLDWDGVR